MSELLNKIIGSSVSNNTYGKGRVTSVDVKIKEKCYVTVLFADNTEKTYLAEIALNNNVLKFDDDDCYNALLSFIAISKNSAIASQKEDTHTIQVKNPITRDLIEKFINDDQIATFLIELYDNEFFEKELYEEAFLYLERTMKGEKLVLEEKSCIVCALSLIALKYYDGDLHSYIEKRYRESRPETEWEYTRSSIQNAVYETLREFRKKTKYFDPNSYVAVPLVVSWVPHYRVKDLFKIAYDIYKKKLLFDEEVTDEQIEDKVYETFAMLRRKDLISDTDTIKGTNYLMSKYTQSCIYSGYSLGALSKIVRHCIRLIISHLSRPEDSFRVPSYYAEGYTKWVSEFENDSREKTKYETNRTISQPYLKLGNNKCHIITGETSLDESLDPNDVHIRVFNNNKLLLDKLLDDPNSIEYVDENSAMSGYIIKRQELIIDDNPLDCLSYTINCGEELVYDSKARLYRSNLFFDGKGNEIKPGNNYIGSLFVITHESKQATNIEEYGDELVEVFRGKDFIISTIEVDNESVFRFDGEPYIFYKLSSAQMISYEIPWASFVSMEKKEYPIYSDVRILFPASCDKEDIYLELDNKRYYYGDKDETYYSIRLFSKEYGETWVYTIKIFNLKAGYHSIKIFNSISGKQIKGASYKVVCDPELRKTYVEKAESGISYHLSGAIIDEQPLFCSFGTPRIDVPAFVKNLGYGSLLIYPSSISYSVDGENWFDIEKRILLFDIPEDKKTIAVCGPRGMTAHLFSGASSRVKQVINCLPDETHSTMYTLYLSLLRSVERINSTRIIFEYGKLTKYANVRYTPYIIKDKCEFYHDTEGKRYRFRIVYEGQTSLKAALFPLHDKTPLLEKVINSGEEISLDEESIDSSIKYLTISLYGRRYGSIFESYQSEPFMSFPKFDLGRPVARLINFPPNIIVRNNQMACELEYECATALKVVVVPSGFETPIYEKIVRNGKKFRMKLDDKPFNSYYVRFYWAYDEDGAVFEDNPFYTVKGIKAVSPFLQQTYAVDYFILTDRSSLKPSYNIRFQTIVEINGKYYLVASLKNRATGSEIRNLIASISVASDTQYVMKVRIIKNQKTEYARLNDWRFIDSVVIRKVGKIL